MAYDVFISYRRSDQAVARALVGELEARGLSVWWDQIIDGGEDWRDAIVHGLENSNALVILFSEECNASKQLRKELAIADTMDKPVIPVLIEDTQPKGHFLYELAARNWVQAFPNPVKKAPELATKLAGDLRADGVVESGGLATRGLASNAPQKGPSRRAVRKQARHLARSGMRDFLPFRWIDIPTILVLSILMAIWLEPDFDDRNFSEFSASYSLWLTFVTATYAAIIIPVRYYMRRRRFWRAVWNYLLSSLVLYGVSFAVFFYGSQVAGLNQGEPLGFLIIAGAIWLVYFVFAFFFYALLSAQRALRSFRKNVETL